MTRFLILDGYSIAGRAEMNQGDVQLAGEMYRDMVLRHRPTADIDIIFPADADAALPAALDSYDAMLWTGSSLTIYDDVPEVTRQISLAREGFKKGVPAFGSCWALQVACIAAGGACGKNPKGLEFGVGRTITLTPHGENHPVLHGRGNSFDALVSHRDIVTQLPSDTDILAHNALSPVQAADFHYDNGSFFAMQYHPEFDLSTIAKLAALRKERMVKQGRYANLAAIQEEIDDFWSLHRKDDATLRDKHDLDDDVMHKDQRENEFANWLAGKNL